MDDSTKTQPPPANPSGSSAGTSRLLRYPLRSSLKPKRDKSPDLPASSSSSAVARRGKSAAISQSVSVLDVPVKQKSVNTPRRLSTQARSGVSSNSTPSSEASVRKSVMSQGKSDTPVSDTSKFTIRERFSVLSTASYWLQQINLSEAAGKHSISLGFFKLAFEAESKPLHVLRDNLQSYVQKYSVTDIGETLTPLLESYDLTQNLKQLQISDTVPQAVQAGAQSGTKKPKTEPTDMEASQTSSAKEPSKKTATSAHAAEDKAQSFDQAAPSLNPSTGTKKPKAKPESSQPSSAKEPSKQAVKPTVTVSKTRAFATRTSCTLKPSAESESHEVPKKVQKLKEQEPQTKQVVAKKMKKGSESGPVMAKKQQKEPAANPVVERVSDTADEDKENKDTPPVEEAAVEKQVVN